MSKYLPLVSIITLNYNQTRVTCEFLESCKCLTYPKYEILVCDMASATSPIEEILKGDYPNTRLLLSNANLGFAGGNNWGMQYAKGDYILIINNDTEVTPPLIEQLLLVFEKHTRAGIVCPKIKFYSQPNRIQYAGFKPMNRITGRTWAVGYQEVDRGQYDFVNRTFGAHGAAMMVKREVIEKVGRFPEKFFLYYEEWDWSTRILNAGYEIYVQGNSSVYHKESISVGKKSALKEFYLTRNRILYMRRNSGNVKFILFFIFFALLTFPKTVCKHLCERNPKSLKAFLKGVCASLVTSSYSRV